MDLNLKIPKIHITFHKSYKVSPCAPILNCQLLSVPFSYIKGKYPSGALKMRSVMCISYCLHD